jgi:negative regulator of sigma-B (phosphoserine phosphatase)
MTGADGPSPQAIVEWGAAHERMPGEIAMGDVCLVVGHERGVLAAAIDGLGHGPSAAAAAQAARTALVERPGDALDELMRRCHNALQRTRGAAVTLTQFDPAGMRWLAVGNVSAVHLRPSEGYSASRYLPLRGGIVGARIPRLRNVDHVPMRPGDLVVLATDGLRSGFSRAVDPRQAPQAIADSVLKQCARGTDDALVLVILYLGGRQG